METIALSADDLGPAKVIQAHEPALGLKAVLVIDNVAAGPSIGGLRMAPDVSTAECARLARAMTFNNAAAGLPHGGGKSVLCGDPRMPAAKKQQLLRAFAYALRGERDYIFDPDMGTDETCMAWVKDEIGRAVGLPVEIGGIPLDEIGATGWGISHAVEVALGWCDFKLEGARVVICAAMEYQGATQTTALQAIEEKIRANTAAMLGESVKRRVAPREAAVSLAAARVRRAMSYRR